MKAIKFVGLLLLCIACRFTVNAQAPAATAADKLIASAEGYFKQMPSEKLYLMFDKPYYTVNDTLWFKCYLLNGIANAPSAQSVKLYVELISDSSKLVNRLVIPVAAGLAQGYIPLSKPVYDGTYSIRAYTNWMQNFGEESFFTREFAIGKPADKGGWTITEQHTAKRTADGNKINFAAKLTALNGMAAPYRDVHLKLFSKDRVIWEADQVTSGEGDISTTFNIPARYDTLRNLTLQVTDKLKKNSTLNIPFYPHGRSQAIDLQFMPEGGALIAGFYNKVGFKAIGPDGKGVNITGVIRNSKKEDVATFAANHLGMGSVMLYAQSGERYTAYITGADSARMISLSLPLQSGINIRADNLSKPDTILLRMTATPGTKALGKPYTLLAEGRDVVYFGSQVKFDNGFVNLALPKKTFATGIVSFVLLNENNERIAERRVFINLHDELAIQATTNIPTYQAKDSIAATIRVIDADKKPVQGNFTLAVVDDGIVTDKKYTDNILSRFLLTSEVKGYVEEPAWYFTADDAQHAKALDDLMLTQAWVGYNWTTPPAVAPKFTAETDNSISGKLEKAFHKPAVGASVTLFSPGKKYGMILIDTLSDENGRFAFHDLPYADTIAYVIKLHNKKGKDMGATISVDEVTPAQVTANAGYPREMPWYVNTSDTLMLRYFNRPMQQPLPGINAADVKGKLLKEVVVKAKKEPVKVGGEFGYPIRELSVDDLVAARKKSLKDLMFEKFKGFCISSVYAVNISARTILAQAKDDLGRTWILNDYCVGNRYIADVFVDGQSVKALYGTDLTGDPRDYYRFLNMFFEYLGADDVTSIKIMEGFHTFMTITTRGGQGPFVSNSPGNLAYRPQPMQLPKQFYSPRYVVKNGAPDDRTTIYWAPNVVTDEDGKATISFYAAGRPGNYTLRIEGTDMKGAFGVKATSITVANSTSVQTDRGK